MPWEFGAFTEKIDQPSNCAGQIGSAMLKGLNARFEVIDMRLYPIEPEIDDALREKYKLDMDDYAAEMATLFDMPPDKIANCQELLLKSYSIRDQAKHDFPFSRLDTMKTLLNPMDNNNAHPLTQLAHKLLTHYKIVDEPFMLTGINERKGRETAGVFCQCFYATVRFERDNIYVYSNWDEGNMCPEIDANLAAILPTPSYLAPLLPRLIEIADEQSKKPSTVYDPPLRISLRTPALETDSPQP
jgi:hypothetical protein